MAGVAGLPSDSNISWCDTKTATENPSKRRVNPRRCRTSRKRPATPEQRGLIAIRAKLGADTEAGHVCSDIVEQFQNYQIAKSTGNAFQLRKLAQLMPERVGQLAKLTQQI